MGSRVGLGVNEPGIHSYAPQNAGEAGGHGGYAYSHKFGGVGGVLARFALEEKKRGRRNAY